MTEVYRIHPELKSRVRSAISDAYSRVKAYHNDYCTLMISEKEPNSDVLGN